MLSASMAVATPFFSGAPCTYTGRGPLSLSVSAYLLSRDGRRWMEITGRRDDSRRKWRDGGMKISRPNCGQTDEISQGLFLTPISCGRKLEKEGTNFSRPALNWRDFSFRPASKASFPFLSFFLSRGHFQLRERRGRQGGRRKKVGAHGARLSQEQRVQWTGKVRN